MIVSMLGAMVRRDSGSGTGTGTGRGTEEETAYWRGILKGARRGRVTSGPSEPEEMIVSMLVAMVRRDSGSGTGTGTGRGTEEETAYWRGILKGARRGRVTSGPS